MSGANPIPRKRILFLLAQASFACALLIASHACYASTPTPSPAPDPLWSTFFGASDHDHAEKVAVDTYGNICVAGSTTSTDFPVTVGAYDTGHNGNYDVIVSRFGPNGNLLWATYLGGGSDEWVRGIETDADLNIYVVGETYSSDFPTTVGAYDTTFGGGHDLFISKFDAGGALMWSTYMGGANSDGAAYWYDDLIALDGSGNFYVTGVTASSDFPTTPGAYDTTLGFYDVFLAKFTEGGGLLWSTLLGGDEEDGGCAIAIDAEGNACLTGWAYSDNFPTTPAAHDSSLDGNNDAFVAKFDSDGGLLWSTYLGGSSADKGYGIAADSSSSVWVFGNTSSNDFPATAGAYDQSYNGGEDTTLTKFASDGTLLWATYLGGSNVDDSAAISLDGYGNAWTLSYTHSSDFPTTVGAYDESHNLSGDAAVSQFGTDGQLKWSSFLGGSSDDFPYDIALASPGVLLLAGDTESSDFPTFGSAYDTTHNGSDDMFATKFILPWPGIVPSDPEVCVGEYLHFTVFLGGGGVWSLLAAPSGGSIASDTGLYQAGATGDTTDAVSYFDGVDTFRTDVSVSWFPRFGGTVGPPTSMDLDGAGVGITDVILLLRCTVGLTTPTADQFAAGDFNCDGTINISDVINCLRVVVGLPPVL